MNHIIASYDNSREEDRLTTDNSRRIEFLTTIRAIQSHLPDKGSILDCAAGTGIYAHHYAELGYQVTALDITPRHVEVMRKSLFGKSYTFATDVQDAVDLSRFTDDTFDVVLCMGPLYHLTEKSTREKCLSECVRVLQKGGLLAVAYISRFFVFPYVATTDHKYLNSDLVDTLLTTGAVVHDDPNCFWTDTYYHTVEEIEDEISTTSVEIIDHLATDGVSRFLKTQVDAMSAEEFALWCDYHYRVCREKSILGASNHGLVLARKPI